MIAYKVVQRVPGGDGFVCISALTGRAVPLAMSVVYARGADAFVEPRMGALGLGLLAFDDATAAKYWAMEQMDRPAGLGGPLDIWEADVAPLPRPCGLRLNWLDDMYRLSAAAHDPGASIRGARSVLMACCDMGREPVLQCWPEGSLLCSRIRLLRPVEEGVPG